MKKKIFYRGGARASKRTKSPNKMNQNFPRGGAQAPKDPPGHVPGIYNKHIAQHLGPIDFDGIRTTPIMAFLSLRVFNGRV